jgi:hypothetical protein
VDPDGRRRRVLDGMRALLRTRAAHTAFHPSSPARWPDAPPSVAAVLRGAPGDEVLALQHLAGHGVRVDGAALLGRRWPAGARDLLTDAPVPDGDLPLGPFEVRWIEAPSR